MTTRALITGITGQDGSYLAELLLEKGYEVFGMTRRSSAPNLWRIEHLLERLTLKPADLLDQLSLLRLVDEVRPHEFYNLAAMSFVPASWDQPMLTGEFNAQGVTRILDAIRRVDPGIKFYQASSSEIVRLGATALEPHQVFDYGQVEERFRADAVSHQPSQLQQLELGWPVARRAPPRTSACRGSSDTPGQGSG